MIRNFRNAGLQAFYETGSTRRLSAQDRAARIRRILLALNAARTPGDMNIPGLRFHPLGEMAPGRFAVEVNGNWRITFAWNGQDAVEVDIEDYH